MRFNAATIRGVYDRLLFWLRELESKAELTYEKGHIKCTIEFIGELQKEFEGVFSRKFTPTEAWSVWRLILDYGERLRSEAAELADIAFWYGLNPWNLSPRQRVALHNNLPRVKAQNTLETGNFSATDYRGVYNLVLLATGDKRQAQKAQTEALEHYVNQKTRAGG